MSGTDGTPTNKHAHLRVLFGGAHPQGRLTAEQREELTRKVSALTSEASLTHLAEQIESQYIEHCKGIIEEISEYTQIKCALETGKHITFVRHQSDILDGSTEGPIDPECERILYQGFLEMTRLVIQRWFSFYETGPVEDEDNQDATP